MIGLTFALVFFAIFMLSILVMDSHRALQKTRREIDAAFGFDTDIFPDHEP